MARSRNRNQDLTLGLDPDRNLTGRRGPARRRGHGKTRTPNPDLSLSRVQRHKYGLADYLFQARCSFQEAICDLNDNPPRGKRNRKG